MNRNDCPECGSTRVTCEQEWDEADVTWNCKDCNAYWTEDE